MECGRVPPPAARVVFRVDLWYAVLKCFVLLEEDSTMPAQTTTPIRTLGVLTGGGDVPGLNAAIKALVYRAETMGIRVTGIRAGWEGITYLDRARGRDDLIFRPFDRTTWHGSYLMPLDRLNTRT